MNYQTSPDRDNMDWSAPNGAIQLISFTSFNVSVVYITIAVVLLAALLQTLIFNSNKAQIFPGWAAIEVAVTFLIISKGTLSRRIYSSIRRYGGSLFGLTSMHQVLVNLPDVDRLMSQSYHILNSEPIQYTFMTRICGAIDTPELKKKSENSWKDLLGPVERQFVNDTAVTALIEKGVILERAASFVTFSTENKPLKRWELSAGLQLKKPGVVEANLYSLTRDFGACFSIPLLYGQDFLNRYPQVLNDFWKFDNDIFQLLMMGIPSWLPFKLIKDGLAARSRLAGELEALYQRIDQYQQGEPVDFSAISDVSNVVFERNKVYNRENWSFRQRGAGDLLILWGQNANTQPLLFWVLVNVYSTSGLLQKVREEIGPYIKFSQASPSKIVSWDLAALSRDCPLIKACIYETYRMAHEPASVRYVERAITIKDGACKHEIKPGSFVTAGHCLTQRDPSVYANPDMFEPNRFLKPDPESGKLSARYGSLRPWGSGAAMCKGRTFAEKEIIALSTAIISLWDISPAGGKWDVPAMIPGMGAKKPVKDIRVVITQRNLI